MTGLVVYPTREVWMDHWNEFLANRLQIFRTRFDTRSKLDLKATCKAIRTLFHKHASEMCNNINSLHSHPHSTGAYLGDARANTPRNWHQSRQQIISRGREIGHFNITSKAISKSLEMGKGSPAWSGFTRLYTSPTGRQHVFPS